MIVGGNEVVQNAEQTGTALKTLSLRIRGAKADLEDLGEETDTMCSSTSELRDQILALTGQKVDIMVDENTFKSTYDILEEVSQVWSSLTDINQSAVLELLGGKRQANILSSIILNWKDVAAATETASNATGSATKENEKYLDSIAGRMSVLSASAEEFSNSFLSSDLIKTAVSGASGFLNIMNSIVSKFGTIKTLIPIIAASLGAVSTKASILTPVVRTNGSTSSIFSTQSSLTSLQDSIKSYREALSKLDEAQIASGAEAKLQAQYFGNLSKSTYSVATSSEAATMSVDELRVAIRAKRLETIKDIAISAAWNLAIGAAVTALIWLGQTIYTHVIKREEYLKNKTDELASSYEDFKNEISSTQSEIDDINSKLDENKSKIEEIQDLGVLSYTDKEQIDSLSDENKQLEQQVKFLERKKELEDDQAKKAAEKAFDGAKTNSINIDTRTPNATSTYLTDVDYETAYQQRIQKISDMESKISQLKVNQQGMDETSIAYKNIQKQIDDYEDKISGYESDLMDYYNFYNGIVDDLEVGSDKWKTAMDVIYSYMSYTPYGSDGSSAMTPFDIIKSKVDSGGYDDITSSFNDISNAISGDMKDIQADIADGDLTLASAAQELIASGELTQEQLDALDPIAKAAGISVNDLVQIFMQLAGIMPDTASSTDTFSSSLVKLSDNISSISGSYNILRQAQDEVSDSGYISASTVENLITQYPELEQYLQLTANGYVLTKGALDDYIASQRQNYTMALQNAQAAAQSIVNSEDAKKAGFEATTGSIREQIAALVQLYSLKASEARANASAQYGDDTIGRLLSGQDTDVKNYTNLANSVANSAEQALLNIDAAQKEVNKYDALVSSLGRDADAAAAGSSSAKEEVEAYIVDVDKYLELEQKLTDIEDERSRIESKIDLSQNYEDRIAYDKELVDLENEQLDALHDINEARREDINTNVSTLRKAGFDVEYDESSNRLLITNMEHINELKGKDQEATNDLRKKYEELISTTNDLNDANKESSEQWYTVKQAIQDTKDEIVDETLDALDKYMDYMDDFDLWTTGGTSKIDALNQKIETLNDLFMDGYMDAEDYMEKLQEAAKDRYDIQKDALDEIVDQTMDMIKNEVQEQIDALDTENDLYQDIIDKKKEALELAKDESDYEDEVKDKVAAIAKLQSQIDLLSLDDSRDAAAQKTQLAQDLADAQNELSDYQASYSYDAQQDALDKEADAYSDMIDEKTKKLDESIATNQKVYALAVQRIQNDTGTLYDEIIAKNDLYGSQIEDLASSWEVATAALQRYGSLADAYTGIKAEATDTIESGQTNVTNMTEIKKIVSQMKANASAWNATTNKATRASLAAKNVELSQQLTGYGINAVKGNDGVWYIDTVGGRKLFNYYHSGGIVGANANLKDNEEMAVLQNGELVVSNADKQALYSVIDLASYMMDRFNAISSSLSSSASGSSFDAAITKAKESIYSGDTTYGGNTFDFDVQVVASEGMTASEAKSIGTNIADAAISKINEAFSRRGIFSTSLKAT